ncbi:MAG: hypothetical protein KBG64_05825 [Clostridia bacterium]|nr:hypothetical protein [Clostridia bacterium]
MADFLTQIRQTEQEAARLVEEAGLKARQIIKDAMNEAEARLNIARAEAGREQQELIRRAEQEAQSIRESAIRQSKDEIDQLTLQSEGKIDQAARLIAERVVRSCADR